MANEVPQSLLLWRSGLGHPLERLLLRRMSSLVALSDMANLAGDVRSK